MTSIVQVKNVKKIINVIAILPLLFFSCLAKSNEPNARVKIDLRGDDIVISIKNISNERILVGKMSVGDEEFSGLWLFMYDPETRENQLASAMTQRVIGLTKDNYPEINVESGQSTLKIFDKKDVLSYFSFSGTSKCYFLTAVYKRSKGTRLVFSRASLPLKICQ